jgi:phosphate uptake regulator
MERKLVRQGRDALTVTLPAKWLKQKGLKAGDVVFVEQHDNFLKLNTSSKVKFSEATIDARKMVGTMFIHELIGRYIEGYDKIEILHEDPSNVQKFSKLFLGMVIEEHTPKRTILKSIISEPENNIDILISRILNMFMQMARIVEDITLKKANAGDLTMQEELLDYTIYYCMRYLNKYSTDDKAYRYFLLCYVIEEAGDILKNISKYSPSKKLATTIREGVEKYVHNMSKGDFISAYTSLRSFRNATEDKDFVNGMAFELVETLYNNLGYLIHRET